MGKICFCIQKAETMDLIYLKSLIEPKWPRKHIF